MSNSCHESVGDSPNAARRLATYLPQFTEVTHPQYSCLAFLRLPSISQFGVPGDAYLIESVAALALQSAVGFGPQGVCRQRGSRQKFERN